MLNGQDGHICSRSFSVIAILVLLSAGRAQNRNEQGGLSSRETQTNQRDGLAYVWVPPGGFQMGCSIDDTECKEHESPPHPVTITKGFWMGMTEVTVEAYKRFAEATRRSLPAEPVTMDRIALNEGWRQGRQPIVNVTWDDAKAYCEWAGGRLATEAEWEYAARAGTTGPRYASPEHVAWYGNTSGDSLLDSVQIMRGGPPGILRKKFLENRNRLREVAQKKANAFGLYDTLGNAWEWVADFYDDKYYSHSPKVDPTGPVSGQLRILRGGAYNSTPNHVRVSDRIQHSPTTVEHVFGCRCVAAHL